MGEKATYGLPAILEEAAAAILPDEQIQEKGSTFLASNGCLTSREKTVERPSILAAKFKNAGI